ncbi:hypothetical protein ASD02_17445 [Ensifer sp. Root1252]|nr:hypothetical protein ASD02_17445 [Ensifer sp. Root1252]
MSSFCEARIEVLAAKIFGHSGYFTEVSAFHIPCNRCDTCADLLCVSSYFRLITLFELSTHFL